MSHAFGMLQQHEKLSRMPAATRESVNWVVSELPGLSQTTANLHRARVISRSLMLLQDWRTL